METRCRGWPSRAVEGKAAGLLELAAFPFVGKVVSDEPQVPSFAYTSIGREDVNSSRPWSEGDADLLWMIKHSRGVSAAALFLCKVA